MMTALSTFGVFLVVVLVLSAFVLLTGRSLKGSCGGVGGSLSCNCKESGKDVGDCGKRISIET